MGGSCIGEKKHCIFKDTSPYITITMYKPWTKVNDELECSNGKGVISKIVIFNNDEFGYEV